MQTTKISLLAKAPLHLLILATLVAGWPTNIWAESSKNLIILKAEYGDLPEGAKTDVTTNVAALVTNDSLKVEASNDIFGDLANGIGKKLSVEYTFNGVKRTKTAEENEQLTISKTGE